MIFRPARRSVDRLIRERVQLALVSAQPHRLQNERRRETRYPYPYQIYLTPVDRDGKPTVGPAIGVVGKHLSEIRRFVRGLTRPSPLSLIVLAVRARRFPLGFVARPWP
jgi:hypothetical protein